jgi:putative ABC transport system permease protein
MGWVGAGAAIGMPAAAALMRCLSSELYGVSATDPAVFILVTTAISAVALLACFQPARRASRVDPLAALRLE